MWWPDAQTYEEDMAVTVPLSTTCATMKQCDLTKCHSSPSGACAPVGAVVEQDGTEMILDTGSSLMTFDAEFCTRKKILTGNRVIHTGYASKHGVVDKVALYPFSLFQTRAVPVCTSSNFGGYQVVGLAPTTNPEQENNSFMNAVSDGQKRFVLDKASGEVCFGRGCSGIDGDHSTIESIHGTDVLSVKEGDTTLILDTGSTHTWKANSSMCIVGYSDIRALDVDYDNGTVTYDIDDANVSSVCA